MGAQRPKGGRAEPPAPTLQDQVGERLATEPEATHDGRREMKPDTLENRLRRAGALAALLAADAVYSGFVGGLRRARGRGAGPMAASFRRG